MAQSSGLKHQTLALCAADLVETLEKWADYLRYEKQVSHHTYRAYTSDLTHFLTFLNEHTGTKPSLNEISGTSITDFRSWMSRKAMDGRCPKNQGGQHHHMRIPTRQRHCASRIGVYFRRKQSEPEPSKGKKTRGKKIWQS